MCVCVCTDRACVFVYSSYQESVSKVTSDGMVGLTRAFLAAGAQCVCVSLWPVPVAASKLFTHTFYSSLLAGARASAALVDAMRSVQSSKQFSHPSNWAGTPPSQSLHPSLILSLSLCHRYPTPPSRQGPSTLIHHYHYHSLIL